MKQENKQVTTLTGITTTGTPHLGNYVGAIAPAIAASKKNQSEPGRFFYFLADYHALVKSNDAAKVRQSTLEIAATWLALGLDPEQVILYRQSDIVEIPQLTWVLTCQTAKGLMNRAHAYKAAVAENIQQGVKDPDQGVTMGLFCYPVLMAADILIFNADRVPVGRDQIQHIEMARDIAGRFNHHYGEHFTLPEAVINQQSETLVGLDGRKMSKSYNNTIPLFADEKTLRKLINKIKTNSLPPEAPKKVEGCTLFAVYRAVAKDSEIKTMAQHYANGIGWGQVKETLFNYLNNKLAAPRTRYQELLANPQKIEDILQQGAKKARQYSAPFMHKIHSAVGITSISAQMYKGS
jgi:tryptophanyl-tRNA synthetase